jgi:DNA-binding XRE family transcriptional regulator
MPYNSVNTISIGEHIAALRKSRCLTQNDIANMLGISFQAVSKWERGETLPDVSLLKELSSILGCTIDGILTCGGNKEAVKTVDNVRMGPCMTSYAAAAYGCLTSAGFFKESLPVFLGMTGLAFRFVVENTACPSSPTIYNWYVEHRQMMDRIGIYSDCFLSSEDSCPNTIKLQQAAALAHIRESIDRGIPVLVWGPTPIPEFGIIYGYDDLKREYLVHDVTQQPDLTLPYDILGRSEVPELFYQIFIGKTPTYEAACYKASLKYALGEWNRAYYPNAGYFSARRDYEALISALENGTMLRPPLAYVLRVYMESKLAAAEYMGFISKQRCFTELDKAADLYTKAAADFTKAADLLPFGFDDETLKAHKAELITLFKSCLACEDEAMHIIGEALI